MIDLGIELRNGLGNASGYTIERDVSLDKDLKGGDKFEEANLVGFCSEACPRFSTVGFAFKNILLVIGLERSTLVLPTCVEATLSFKY